MSPADTNRAILAALDLDYLKHRVTRLTIELTPNQWPEVSMTVLTRDDERLAEELRKFQLVPLDRAIEPAGEPSL